MHDNVQGTISTFFKVNNVVLDSTALIFSDIRLNLLLIKNNLSPLRRLCGLLKAHLWSFAVTFRFAPNSPRLSSFLLAMYAEIKMRSEFLYRRCNKIYESWFFFLLKPLYQFW